MISIVFTCNSNGIFSILSSISIAFLVITSNIHLLLISAAADDASLTLSCLLDQSAHASVRELGVRELQGKLLLSASNYHSMRDARSFDIVLRCVTRELLKNKYFKTFYT